MIRGPLDGGACVVYAPSGTDDREATIVLGALRHAGITAQIRAPGEPAPTGRDVLSVGLSPAFGMRQPPADRAVAPAIDVLAGRAVTRAFLHEGLQPCADQALIYGEPYDLIVRLSTGDARIDELRGQTVRGSSFDVTAYTSPPGGRVLTSLGCVKECAYCSYGANQRLLYGDGFRRRERPWLAVAEEIAEHVAGGGRTVAFLADQFLAVEPDGNRQLARVADNVRLPRGARPVATFTTAPRDVLANRALVARLNDLFEARPTLSIDSLDDGMLARCRVGFDAAEALRAAACLTGLNIPFRLNYIFARPWMTAEALGREFSNLHALALIVRDRPTPDQWLVLNDVFGSRLVPIRGAPLWTGSGETSASDGGTCAELPGVMDRVCAALAEEPAAPFLAAVEAALDALSCARSSAG
jgi:hypothetical protein